MSSELEDLKDFELELETLTNKNQANKLAEDYFINFLKTNLPKETLDSLDEPETKEFFDALVLVLSKLALNKRMYCTSLIGVLGLRLKDYQKASNYLEDMINQKLINYDFNKNQFIVKYELPQEIWDKLTLFQNPLPMIVEPVELVHNYDTGYYNCNLKKNIISKHPTKKDVYLNNINRMNTVPLRINETVFKNTVNSWKNLDKEITKKNFNKFYSNQQNIVNYYLKNFSKFYLTWSYDHRGRFYDTGYLIKVQGNQYQKGLLELAEEELIQD